MFNTMKNYTETIKKLVLVQDARAKSGCNDTRISHDELNIIAFIYGVPKDKILNDVSIALNSFTGSLHPDKMLF